MTHPNNITHKFKVLKQSHIKLLVNINMKQNYNKSDMVYMHNVVIKSFSGILIEKTKIFLWHHLVHNKFGRIGRMLAERKCT